MEKTQSELLADTSDEEVIQNLELLLNMDSLEQSDYWDELINLSQLESDPEQTEGD